MPVGDSPHPAVPPCVSMQGEANGKPRIFGEDGFSLVELLVVVIIIGILSAIAVPAYINQRQQAYESAVQSDLRNAATAATACSVDNDGLYDSCTIEVLERDYGFSPTDSVNVTDGEINATRWAATATYEGQQSIEYYFDTEDGSQVRPVGNDSGEGDS